MISGNNHDDNGYGTGRSMLDILRDRAITPMRAIIEDPV